MDALNTFAQALGWFVIAVVVLLAVVGVLATAGRGLDEVVRLFWKRDHDAESEIIRVPQAVCRRESSDEAPDTTSGVDARSAGESK